MPRGAMRGGTLVEVQRCPVEENDWTLDSSEAKSGPGHKFDVCLVFVGWDYGFPICAHVTDCDFNALI